MRFHTAATFLAQSYLLPWSADSLAVGDKKKRQLLLQQILLQQKRQEKALYAEGEKEKKDPLKEGFPRPGDAAQAQVEASQLEDALEELKECQLAPAKEDLDSVLGFLAGCGLDEECVESELSKTEGVCVKTTGQLYKENVQRRAQYSPSYLCALPICDCTNFDATTSVGSIVCTNEGDTPDGYCITSSGVEFCYTNSYTFYFSGNQYYDTYRLCVEFTSGPLDSVCSEVAYEGTCEITVDDVMCPSCIVATCPVGSEEEDGLIWDCSGTALADVGTATGNSCDGDEPLPEDLAPTPATPTGPGTLPPTTPAPIPSDAGSTPAPVPATPMSTPMPTPPPTPSPTTSAASTTKTALVSVVALVVGGMMAAVAMA